MAKFEVCINETIERASRYTIDIRKKDVVNSLELQGDDVKEWQEHVSDYVQQHWDDLKNQEGVQADESEDMDVSHEVESVTLMDE
jgi:hypothetical protein